MGVPNTSGLFCPSGRRVPYIGGKGGKGPNGGPPGPSFGAKGLRAGPSSWNPLGGPRGPPASGPTNHMNTNTNNLNLNTTLTDTNLSNSMSDNDSNSNNTDRSTEDSLEELLNGGGRGSDHSFNNTSSPNEFEQKDSQDAEALLKELGVW